MNRVFNTNVVAFLLLALLFLASCSRENSSNPDSSTSNIESPQQPEFLGSDLWNELNKMNFHDAKHKYFDLSADQKLSVWETKFDYEISIQKDSEKADFLSAEKNNLTAQYLESEPTLDEVKDKLNAARAVLDDEEVFRTYFTFQDRLPQGPNPEPNAGKKCNCRWHLGCGMNSACVRTSCEEKVRGCGLFLIQTCDGECEEPWWEIDRGNDFE